MNEWKLKENRQINETQQKKRGYLAETAGDDLVLAKYFYDKNLFGAQNSVKKFPRYFKKWKVWYFENKK